MPSRDLAGSEKYTAKNRSGLPDGKSVQAIEAAMSSRSHYRTKIVELVRDKKYVVFYGCGVFFHSLEDTWNKFVGRRVDFCCDSDPAKWGHTFCGSKCLSPDELQDIKDDCIVFVTVGNFRPVVDQLIAAGFPAVHLIYKYDLVNSDFLDQQDIAAVAKNLSRARSLLCDEKSCRVFDAIVERVAGGGSNWQLMADIYEGDQYFPSDIITLNDREWFVDCGAFNGDTVTDFVRRTGGCFDRIDAFELDRANFEDLRKNVSRLPSAERIHPLNVGIWDREQDVTYSAGKAQSALGEGTFIGHVVPLDAVLRGDPVSFIKIDIEGAEPQALRGAEGIITASKPTLTVCVYHRFAHLWEIPLIIHELVPEYRLFLRHHTQLEYETVCYAVPPR